MPTKPSINQRILDSVTALNVRQEAVEKRLDALTHAGRRQWEAIDALRAESSERRGRDRFAAWLVGVLLMLGALLVGWLTAGPKPT